ncbi:hypothetical protein, partial [Chromohalobacter sp. HP20-39]|uniref:hypothetical protein n=1 Tax=Chromohalobacter sp. HP20-39 TaxID=3079306 RepID=UPI00294B85D7
MAISSKRFPGFTSNDWLAVCPPVPEPLEPPDVELVVEADVPPELEDRLPSLEIVPLMEAKAPMSGNV